MQLEAARLVKIIFFLMPRQFPLKDDSLYVSPQFSMNTLHTLIKRC